MADEWRALNLDVDVPDPGQWAVAVEMLEDRLKARFLRPGQALIDLESGLPSATYGFAILALDFLVIETIEGFREGLHKHNGKSARLFTSFLTSWSAFTECVPAGLTVQDAAERLYANGRCALHHSGTTDSLKVTRRGARMLTFHTDGRIDVNRTAFHAELNKEFEAYLTRLRNPAEKPLRRNFIKKMSKICEN